MEQAVRPPRVPRSITSLFVAVGLGMALGACGGGGGGGAGPVEPPAPPPVAPPVFTGLPDFAAAAMVFGQADFTSADANRGGIDPEGRTLFDPAGVAVAQNGMLFIADSANRRVLGFHRIPDGLDQSADFALGQPDLVHGGDTDEIDGYDAPKAVSVGAGVVAVADPAAHRVLLYHGIPTDGTARPTTVVGQSRFDVPSSPACTDVNLSRPEGVHITPDGALIVADGGHSRVLIWKPIPGPGEHGKPANVILGQPSATSCSANAGGTSPGRSTMDNPIGVWSDGKRLAVADTVNHRVLLWDQLTMQSGQEPDRVLGQPNFESRASDATSAETLGFPRGVASNGRHLAVSDSGHHRVLLWSEWPSRDGQAAEAVIGQRDMTQDESDGLTASAQTLDAPYGVTFHEDKLLVIDESNHRLLIFKSD
ncbi:hypothetical protein EZ313_08830 [Ramlibacter henchirensis]|uniref:NHL repeat-containing protein n=1 Tax=Ramlibacter henchirensis TaxID=204072 RepID=A0A4Z0C8F8_9BURK|nr:hypothetical protein [Ramlibacter henchirensis]TFZ06710.1 hypothetical protein EZ313_08830 [Ramlibacter henchirensis]